MRINEKNIIEELTHCINELTLIVSALHSIDADTPVNHEYVTDLDNRYSLAARYMPDFILFIGNHRLETGEVAGKFLEAIELNDAFLKEKIRIIDNTPDVYLETNDFINLN